MRFNPYKLFNGSFIPEVVSKIPSKELSDGAKIVYGRLMRYSGKNGVCRPKRKTLADEVGKTVSTIDKKTKELCSFGLLEKKQRGSGKSNEYYFLFHEVFGDNSLIKDDSTSLPDITSQPLSDSTTPIVRESIQESSIYKYILPEALGNTYQKRIWNFYSLVWRERYGFNPDADWKKLGPMIKKMYESYSEYQIAILILTHFEWHGASGSDEYVYKRLVEACFPFTWIPTSISAYKAHQCNVLELMFDSEEACKKIIDDYLKKERH